MNSSRELTERLNVLQLCLDLDLGGVEEVVRLMVRNLDKQRYAVSVLTFNPGRVARELEKNGLKVHSLDLSGMSPITRQFAKVRMIIKVLRDEQIDILHNHNCFQVLPALLFRKVLGLHFKAVYSVHQFAPWRRLKGFLYGRCLAAHDLVLPVSSPVRELLIGRYRVPIDRVRVNHNTVEPRTLTGTKLEAKCRLRLPDDCFLISHVGRLVSNKNADMLIRVAAKLAPEYPHIRVLIAGKGAEHENLKELAERICPNYVEVKGYVEDLTILYRASDVHVSMGSAETFSLVTLEAMSQESAAIACVPNGVVDVIDDEVTGFLIPAENECALEEKLRWLLTHPGETSDMGIAGRERIREAFRIEEKHRPPREFL